jgi:hypothetical protein
MIRFVEVRGVYLEDEQGNEKLCFGFWDTVYDRFVRFADQVLFESMQDWKESIDFQAEVDEVDAELVERCERLVPPKWRSP